MLTRYGHVIQKDVSIGMASNGYVVLVKQKAGTSIRALVCNCRAEPTGKASTAARSSASRCRFISGSSLGNPTVVGSISEFSSELPGTGLSVVMPERSLLYKITGDSYP